MQLKLKFQSTWCQSRNSKSLLGTLNGFEVCQSNNDGFAVWEWLACGHFYKPIRHLEILKAFSILCVIYQMSWLFWFVYCCHITPNLIQLYTSVGWFSLFDYIKQWSICALKYTKLKTLALPFVFVHCGVKYFLV